MTKRKLTPKQERFAEEYIVDLNASAAALRAGYKHPDNGRQLLTKTHVSDRIGELKRQRSERTRVSQDRVVTELARLAFTNMRDFMEWGPEGLRIKSSDELSEDDAAAVTHLKFTPGEGFERDTVEIKLGHKDSALRMLGQHLGIFVERHEHTGKDCGPIRQEVRTDFDLAADIREIDRHIAELEAQAREEEGSL